MTHCPDCGSKMYNGACTWCHEETYIYQQHLEDPCCELGDKFLQKVEDQRKEIKRNQEREKDE